MSMQYQSVERSVFMYIIIVLTIILLFFLISYIFIPILKSFRHRNDSSYIYKHNIEKLVNITNTGLKNTMKTQKNFYVIYVGRYLCPDCYDISFYINQEQKRHPKLPMFYYDAQPLKDKDPEFLSDYHFFTDSLKAKYTPTVLLVNNGKLLKLLSGKKLISVAMEKEILSVKNCFEESSKNNKRV